MYHVALWINLITFAKIICTILASTHWIVTDEGFIQPILDSPFHLKVPNDLLAFLDQDNRLSEIHSIYQHFLERKIILEQSLVNSLNEAQEIQNKYKTNDNCMKSSNKKFKDLDLSISFTSDGSDREGISFKDFFPLEYLSDDQELSAPDCQRYIYLPFSMHTFDHLQSMKDRFNLSMIGESGLEKWMLGGTDMKLFGHHVSHILMHNTTSWLHYNLATIYWRIIGNVSNALECSRRAVYFSPRQYKDIPLMNMGGVLYGAQRYTDAAIVFHAAIDHSPEQAINHYMLANAYASIAEFDKAAACFKNVAHLKPWSEQAWMNQNMMHCYAFRVVEILDIHNSIQEMRKAFDEYQAMFSKWQASGIKALNIQSSLNYKIMDNPDIMFNSVDTLFKNSLTSTMADKKILRYSLLQNHDMFSTDLFGMLKTSSSLYKTIDNFQSQINEISDNYELSDDLLLTKKNEYDLPQVTPLKGPVLGIDDENGDSSIITSVFNLYLKSAKEKVLARKIEEKEVESPPIRYHKDKMKVSRMKYDFDKNSEWPLSEECDDKIISKLVDLKGNTVLFPVYLPVENKGFNVSRILSHNIRVDLSVEHPLPWHPPTCPSTPLAPLPYIPEGLKVKAKLLPHLQDQRTLRDMLMYSIHGDLDANKQHQDAEIGHRIHLAMKLRASPMWVLYTLSSLYWRVRKNVANTLDCLVSAIEDVPHDFKDVPLTSLASILYELGYTDNAFKLANEAHQINMFEPATNFLLALIHNKNTHVLGQMYHIKQAIRVEQQFMFGKAYELLVAWSCHSKFSIKFAGKLEDSEEPMKGSQVHVLSKEGIILSMLCTTMWDGQSCHPSNVFIYDSENEIGMLKENGVIPLTITEEKSLSKVFASSVDLFTKATFRINLMFEDTLFKVAVPLMQLSESTVETKDAKLLFKSDVTSSHSYVIDKNGYHRDLGKFAVLVPSKSDTDWFYEIFEWFVNDKQILFSTNKEVCSKIKPIESMLFSKQIWNLFLERFPTLNQILTPFETTSSLEPECRVSDSLTPESDMLGWYFKKQKQHHSEAFTEKIIRLLRKLMSGSTAPLDKLGSMIAHAIKDHEESWILKVLAGVYYSAKGNSQMSITCMKQALVLAPEHDKDVPLLGLSAVSYWVNSVHDAIVYSKFAYEIHPKFPAAPLLIGFMFTFTKRENEAFLMLRKAYTIDMELTIIEDIIKYILCHLKAENRLETIFEKHF